MPVPPSPSCLFHLLFPFWHYHPLSLPVLYLPIPFACATLSLGMHFPLAPLAPFPLPDCTTPSLCVPPSPQCKYYPLPHVCTIISPIPPLPSACATLSPVSVPSSSQCTTLFPMPCKCTKLSPLFVPPSIPSYGTTTLSPMSEPPLPPFIAAPPPPLSPSCCIYACETEKR